MSEEKKYFNFYLKEKEVEKFSKIKKMFEIDTGLDLSDANVFRKLVKDFLLPDNKKISNPKSVEEVSA